MPQDVELIQLISLRVESNDTNGLESIEAWIRFSRNGGPAQIFCGNAKNSAHAFEKAFRQMLHEFGHLDDKMDDSLFHHVQFGIIRDKHDDQSRHTHSARLMARSSNGALDSDLAHGLAEGSTRRAIAKALSILYGKTCGVEINVHWEQDLAGE